MPVVTQESRDRILGEAERGARLAARSLGTQTKDEKTQAWRQMTAGERTSREEDRVTRALKYAFWRIDAYERGECSSPW